MLRAKDAGQPLDHVRFEPMLQRVTTKLLRDSDMRGTRHVYQLAMEEFIKVELGWGDNSIGAPADVVMMVISKLEKILPDPHSRSRKPYITMEGVGQFKHIQLELWGAKLTEVPGLCKVFEVGKDLK